MAPPPGPAVRAVLPLRADCVACGALSPLNETVWLPVRSWECTALACGDLSAADLASAAAFLAASSLVSFFSLVLAAAQVA